LIGQTIINIGEDTVNDVRTLALRALGWVLSDDARANRFLALTGLTPEDLRSRLDSPELQRAVFDFLAAYEPDLIAAAEALGVEPAQFAAPIESFER
jgi:hypothetical protein